MTEGIVLLPNGWRIAPAGKHLPLDDLPMNLLESPDGNYIIVTNNGYSKPVLDVIDLRHFYVSHRVAVENAWLGLAWSSDGKTLYSSAAGASAVQVFSFLNGELKPQKSFRIRKPDVHSFVAGLCLSPDGKTIFAVQVLGNTLSRLDARTGKGIKSVALDAEPYTCLLSADGKRLFVSLWGGSRVVEFDPLTLTIRREITVGEHPSAFPQTARI